MTMQYTEEIASGTRARLPMVYRNGDETAIKVRIHGELETAGTRSKWHVETSIDRQSEDQCIRARFEVYAEWWRADTGDVSSPRRMISHPAYQQIIALGWPVVPHILAELRDNGGYWFPALRQITNDPPSISDEDRGNVDAVRRAWIEWGKGKGFIV